MNRYLFLAALSAASILSACTTGPAHRHEGVSYAAGDAIAANTVMQMVDPWPAGVEQTHLSVPADLNQYRKAEPADGEAGESITSE